MKFDRQNGIAEYIANGTDKQTGFDNVIICTATLSNELIYNLAFIKSMNKNPVLVYSVPANYDPKSQLVMLEFLMHQGVEHYIIKNAGELKICLES
jgi:hypothetical protein